MQAEVAAVVMGRSQLGTIMAAPEELARTMPSVAQVTASSMGQTEGDMAKGSPEVVMLGEESASVPLTPSVVGESVPARRHNEKGRRQSKPVGSRPWP